MVSKKDDWNWMDKKNQFNNQFNDLNVTDINTPIAELNKSVGSYIHSAGLSQLPTNPNYENITKNLNIINNLKQKYSDLNTNIQNVLTEQAKKTDWNSQLIQNGQMQTEINRLEKIEKDMKVDVDSALARDELLRTRNTNVTKHDYFLFNHPIRRSTIPYLWVLSILFIGLGLAIFKSILPSFHLQNSSEISTSLSIFTLLSDFLTNKIILITLLLSASIVILFLGLKVGGVF